MRRSVLWSLVLLPCVTISCAAPASRGLSAADVAANKALSEHFKERVMAKDWAAVGASYTADAILLPPNSPAIKGRAGIQAYFMGFPPASEVILVDDTVYGEGDVAVAVGHYKLTLAVPGNPVDSGNFLDVRQRQADGTWLYTADMFGTAIPAPAPPAPAAH